MKAQNRLKSRTALLTLVLFVGHSAHPQNADVTFFVIGKHVNYVQETTGELAPVDYSFFSEVFLAANGDATDATLVFPTNEEMPFRDMREVDGAARDNIFLISGEDRFTDYPALQTRYPDGRYRVSFDTPSGSVQDGILRFEDRSLPTPPRLSLQQGTDTGLAVLSAGTDAIVHWSEFAEGRSDPNGILDDLVFVILTNEAGVRIAHSGRPFEGQPYLTYADRLFMIDGRVLDAGHNYVLSVEHAILDDTTRFGGVPAFTTRAVTTKLTFTTAPAE